MSGRYVLVDGEGRVENVVLWDGQSEWTPPPGMSAAEAPSGVGIGWRLEDGEWLAPVEDQ